MLKKKLRTAHDLFREGGLGNVGDYLWLRLQVLTSEYRNEIRIDQCKFSLKEVVDVATRIELIRKTYEAPEHQAVARYLPRDLPVGEFAEVVISGYRDYDRVALPAGQQPAEDKLAKMAR